MRQPLPLLSRRSGWLGFWPDGGVKGILDPIKQRIRVFLQEEASQLPTGCLVLDAGAGKRPYASIFSRQNYESCDVECGFYNGEHDFICTLSRIPQPSNRYQAVLLTQVLEHVPDPQAALNEISRVLKVGGVILASVPLNAPLHGEPWHYFHFTHYGLAELAIRSNLEIIRWEKLGGAFWFLGRMLPDTISKLIKQWDPGRAKKRGQNVWLAVAMTLVILPFYLLFYPLLAYLVRPLCYWLDRLDRMKTLTLGYTVVLQKTA